MYKSLSTPVQWLIPFLAVAVAAITGFALEPFPGQRNLYGLFFLSIAVSALLSGFLPGLLATFLSAITVEYLFIEPGYGFLIDTLDARGLIIFVLIGAAISYLGYATARTRKEAAAATGRLRATFDNAALGIFEANGDNRIVAANARMREIAGRSEQELLGMTIQDLAAPEDQTLSRELNAKLQSGEKKLLNYEKRFLRRDGTPVWVHVTVSAIKDPKEHFVRAVGTVEDISERKHAEESIRESEKAQSQLAAIIESSEDAILSKDLHGTILTWNVSAERLFGYREEEAVGKPIITLIPSELLREEERIMERLKHGDKIEHYETVRVAKDGRCIDVSLTVSPLRNTKGEITGASTIIRDITGRKKADEALRSSEERLQAFMTHLPGAVWIKDAGGHYVYANPEAERIFGVSIEHLRGKTDDEVFPPETARQFRENDRRVEAEDGQLRTTEILRYPDGVEHHSIVSKFRVPGPEGYLIAGVAFDITDRLKASQALRESEERLKLATQAAKIGTFDCNVQTGLNTWSPELEAMHGLQPGEFEGTQRAWEQLVYPEDRGQVVGLVSRAFETFEPQEGEWRILWPDNSVHWVMARFQVFKDAAGKPLKVSGVNIDITERKKNEERQELQAAIIESSATGIAISSRDGAITWANPAVTELTGYKTEEMLGENPRLFKSGEHPGSFYQNMWNTILAGKVWHGELKNRRKDGTLYDEDLVITPVRAGGDSELTHFVAIKTDITARKQAEKEKHDLEIQAQRAQRLESIGILAGGIAHDFNNLLAGLFGYMEVARMNCQEGRSGEAKSTLDRAISVFDRAKDLAKQLLTFSKGGSPITEVASIVTPIEQSAGIVLSGSNVELDIRNDRNLWPCKIDKNQIGQVIDNILINAKEAMPGGGKVHIKTKNIRQGSPMPKTLMPGNYVRVSIRDQGSGITRDIQEHIFDPFFSTKGTGHGLGLSIAYSIVKRHNGIIEVESEINKGTTFHVYLPALPQSGISPKETQPVWEHQAGSMILVMDDEEAIREVLGAILTSYGHSVGFAREGEEAVRLYRQALETSRPFDLVILDLTVRGGLGGKETIERLREIDPAVCAIVSSGYSQDPIMANPKAFGFKAALKKPYQPEDLRKMVQESLSPSGVRWLQAV